VADHSCKYAHHQPCLPPPQGAGLLAEGSELLLEIVNPGIIGGVVLPVLGALPDSLIILSSLAASQTEAQEALAVGVGERGGGGSEQTSNSTTVAQQS
jgi:hypothetical protein